MRTSAPAAAPIFRSDQQMRLLGALFTPDHPEWSVTELAALSKVAVATASREVERLEEHGIVSSRMVGRTKLVAANWSLPWAEALQTILAHAVGVPALLAAALKSVHGITEAWIYGSWAARFCGQPGPPPKDIDVVVVGHIPDGAVASALHAAERQLGKEINPLPLTAHDWESADPLIEEIKANPRVPIDLDDHA
ncbi:MAG: winged helix-turn-helix domain-containing protein [Actinomycetota bacterium]|nr:winged helix-turn-helix domain-containing protein [Actinomycetota bacterium]